MATEYNVSIVKKSTPETSEILDWLSCAELETLENFPNGKILNILFLKNIYQLNTKIL